VLVKDPDTGAKVNVTGGDSCDHPWPCPCLLQGEQKVRERASIAVVLEDLPPLLRSQDAVAADRWELAEFLYRVRLDEALVGCLVEGTLHGDDGTAAGVLPSSPSPP
jgi:hypothetical protein